MESWRFRARVLTGKRRAGVAAVLASAFVSVLSAQPGPLPATRLFSASGAAWGGIVAFDSDQTSYFNLTANSWFCNAVLSGPNYKDTYPSVSNNGVVAFQSGRGADGFRIFVMNLDGSGLRQITFGTGLQDPLSQQDLYPAIARDGTKVAFLRRTTPDIPGKDIYVIGADGTGLRRITTYQPDPGGKSYSGIESVAWNQDGTKLAFRGLRTGNGSLRQVLGVINPDGTGEQHLLDWGTTGYTSYLLDWSADGRKILFAPVQDLNLYHILDYPSGTQTGIAASALGQACANPGCVRLSPDGAWLVYQQTFATGSSPTFIRTDGTGLAVLQNLSFGIGEPLFWAPHPAVADPAGLELSPNPLYVWTGHSETAIAHLRDAAGNVLAQAVAGWQIPQVNGYAPRVSSTGEVFAGTQLGDWELDGINGGMGGTSMTGSLTIKVRNAPVLAIEGSHQGDFRTGSSAVYTLKISHAGDSFTAPTAGMVAVTDTLPRGLNATAIGGAGWSCALPTLTCTRSDALSPGASYPPISVTVAVKWMGRLWITNQVNVSGGGAAAAGAGDVTTISGPPHIVRRSR